jgi:polysaccharide biosynthesis protein PslJ
MSTISWGRPRTVLRLPLVLSRPDLVAFLGIFLGLLLLIPGRFAFTFYSESLTPAVALGVLAFWLWACLRIVPGLGLAGGRQPVRVIALFLLWSGGASWAAAFLRAIPPIESRAAIIGVLFLISGAGVALLAADGIQRRFQLDALLGWLVIGASVVATIGIVQFFTGFDVSRYLRFPGLGVGTVAGASFIDVRSSFRRVEATATHPIEFAVFLTMVLPLALHYARMSDARQRVQRWGRWLCVALLLIALPTTLSRSGIVGLAVVGLMLLPTWPVRQSLLALGAMFGFAVALRGAVPGLVGTVVSLFTYFGSDPSINQRLGDYSAAAPYIAAAPLFGRGFHTWIPSGLGPGSLQFVTDNQYLLSLLETGLVGLIALLGVVVGGVMLARYARQRSSDARSRDLAQSLATSMVVATVAFATFDALSFPIVRGLTFFLLGCAGALWRIQGAQPAREAQ